MFAKPRPKKLLLSHPSKKRKFTSAVEEVTFDNAARHEYLTGFHKRKQAHQTRQRLEKIETRKQVREERKKEVEDHVNMVNKLLRNRARPARWKTETIQRMMKRMDGEVTVESVSVSRDGLEKPVLDEPTKEDEPEEKVESKTETKQPAKKKKPKFRYETKFDRQLAERKHRAKKAKR
ncbi:unnamed protein product [Clonostachys rosea f. rosea IK726]|uniref:Uncharacterized protein n=1 Tax=Clonostachys rosea f. rosea IK726 TaxID=1349383 RepID=A0ACA9UUT8_BIOOC|nr:unnamed protein product [Clonostachys rosea f. rosea IK726]